MENKNLIKIIKTIIKWELIIILIIMEQIKVLIKL